MYLEERVSNFLTEIFDRPVAYEEVGPNEWEFTVADVDYIAAYDDESAFFLDFVRSVDTLRTKYLQLSQEEQRRLRQESGEFSFMVNRDDFFMSGQAAAVLGVGNQFSVFSTAFELIRREIVYSRDKPFVFWFSAKEPSRRKLYTTFAKNIQRKLPEVEYLGSTENMNHEVFLFWVS